MLPKKNRLKKGKDFQKIFKEGKGFKEGFLFLKVAENGSENSRFGFSISKSFSKKSSLRNKIKRKLQELIRARTKKIKKGVDGLIVVYAGLEKNDFWEIEESLDNLFKKAGLL